MENFSFFIEDDRHLLPTINFVTTKDIGRARELAATKLRASPHYLSIEVVQGDRPVFRLSRRAAGSGGKDSRGRG